MNLFPLFYCKTLAYMQMENIYLRAAVIIRNPNLYKNTIYLYIHKIISLSHNLQYEIRKTILLLFA